MKGSENGNRNDGLRRLRPALLNWYPFPGGDRALVLGDNTEPLLPLLKRYYRTADTRLEDGARYDCIAAADLAERTEDLPALLRRLCAALSSDGVLLLAFRNRFGLKYLCGGTDEYVRAPFATLQPRKDGGRLYGRNEMCGLLEESGFEAARLYYLMPDADFVQAVYTGDRLPEDSIRDRVLPFDRYGSPLVAWEGDLYDDLVREGTLPYAANVCLAECRKPGAPRPERRVIYAALSTDRGPENGFATVLYSDETAEKRPLYPEGMAALRRLCANMEELKARGILTVEHELTEEGVRMPLVREEGLLRYLRRRLPEDPETFYRVFDRILEDVMRSSEETGAAPEDAEEIWGAGADRLGPILRRAWIDMIPYNAFWSDGAIRYYDQEFTVENCPAKYVLFRALRYTWIHIPEAEKLLDPEKVKARYGLTGCWEGFFRREERFVSENRNRKALREIYDAAWPDRKAMADRRAALDPAAALGGVHRVQLELLRELDRVCRENGLTYMAVHGTLLGAARHGGFIPWDEDADVCMPRADYDRLLALGAGGFAPGFFLQTPENNSGCFYGGYAKLRRDGTCARERRSRYRMPGAFHEGIWIDILPLDPCPAEENARRRLQKRLGRIQRILYAKTYKLPGYVPGDVPGSRVSLYYLLAKVTRRRDLLRRLERLCRSRRETGTVGILACYYGSMENRNVWPEAFFRRTERLPFEDLPLPVPAEWEEILRRRYGEEYRELPPPWKRRPRKDVDFSL